MKEYLLDTNIYIDSYDRYYRSEFFPTYWENFSNILNDHVVIPNIVKNEITKSLWFQDWLSQNYSADFLNHKDYSDQWQTILQFVQSCGLYKDSALIDQSKGWANEAIADPWIIAIAQKEHLTIVSEEQKIPNLGQGVKVKVAKIPDICEKLNIRCITRNEFFSEIGLLV